MQIKKYPTWIGYTALVFWALAAPFAVRIKNIPVFETLTIVFTVSFLFSATRLTLLKQWSKLKQPWLLWLIGFLGIYGNDLLYLAAFKHAPAAQADLINYLWPVIVILFTGLLPDEKLSLRHIIAASMGFAGVFVLINKNGQGFDSQYLFGYILAFLDAIVWSVYTLVARRYGKSPVEMIGMYCGVGALCSLIIHFYFEPHYLPTGSQWIILIMMGMTTQCLAYFFWDFGIKRGDFKLLSILSYGNPILSIGFLIFFGMAEPTIELIIACLLVTAGGIIGIIPWQSLYYRWLHGWSLEIATNENDSR
ncbi:EamA family transporter [Legionella israelensis]|uniref:Aromatic amino acid exporter YddG n=1 Tax=Legionella israelensis TaxID=454 RepID=A0A0W0V333_9GAMM|nr:EamA family transporter [Legionella israelensis]KTD14301.1 Aromatic amino acid exporter YddG [Legionella israelensis]QBR84651.1 EamA family transporter [Legionella israelensis]QBS10543.1 EamA family transporter [Legionella israelensis]QDP72227.1 EamA family transporter [Legionella israelensis]SCX94246.1 Permease of the drug/metabolite transporter (DMT) superfamily [Legionella israelensis DSM 19235]